jgi:hypothetical protein
MTIRADDPSTMPAARTSPGPMKARITKTQQKEQPQHSENEPATTGDGRKLGLPGAYFETLHRISIAAFQTPTTLSALRRFRKP